MQVQGAGRRCRLHTERLPVDSNPGFYYIILYNNNYISLNLNKPFAKAGMLKSFYIKGHIKFKWAKRVKLSLSVSVKKFNIKSLR